MKAVEIQFHPWDKIYNFTFDDLELVVGDYVIVDTKIGTEIGRVVKSVELDEAALAQLPEQIKPITRKATKEDLEHALEQKKSKSKVFNECRALIKKHNLPIKLVDVHFAFDDSRITFAFIAEGRVDFRDLLKDLNKNYKKNIRLQQIGIRDEIKISGDIGCCGRSLCCQSFYKELGNVTSDLAELQQVSHRGSERLSGVCGRLKCCLTYEKAVYEDCAEKLPMVGDTIRTPNGKGEVIGWHVLKKSVDVLLDDRETIVEVQIEK
ncbi:stage 0 sporulation protein [Patescibacteria group bacterium]|nr:stage 0 sporulation protein [Patescibacteria group bacterium]